MINKILVIHGPNLNLLGEREPGVYGNTSIDVLNDNIIDRAKEQGMQCEIFQSNHEGAIIDKLHAARTAFDAVIINAGAYTHYSYAIRAQNLECCFFFGRRNLFSFTSCRFDEL